MRLRNKNTGKIWHMPRLRQPTVQEDDISFFACISEHGCSRGELFSYKTLDELNEEWEDYKPAEPLIKDEKIRKAVRAWAEVNEVNKVTIEKDFSTYAFYPTDTDRVSISVWTEPSLSNLSRGKIYTISELCGEGEE